jgi:hypothetical protein
MWFKIWFPLNLTEKEVTHNKSLCVVHSSILPKCVPVYVSVRARERELYQNIKPTMSA